MDSWYFVCVYICDGLHDELDNLQQHCYLLVLKVDATTQWGRGNMFSVHDFILVHPSIHQSEGTTQSFRRNHLPYIDHLVL